ncbi:hypothetical protein GGF45_004063, partial [Coemansia sp. RSA 551]
MTTLPEIRTHSSYSQLAVGSHDAVVAVYTGADILTQQQAPYTDWEAAAAPFRQIDKEFGKSVVLVPAPSVGGGRLVLSPIDSVEDDTDDVRKVFDAVKSGVARAIEAGARRPAVYLAPLPASVNAVPDADYSRWIEVALLAALEASYVTLVVREHRTATLGADAVVENLHSIDLVVESHSDEELRSAVKRATAIEGGRRLALDMGYGDPERMTPYKCAETIQAAAASVPGLEFEVIKDLDMIKQDYPLLYHSARASFA